MSGSGHDVGDGAPDGAQVGTLAEEALRLFGALADVARHGPRPEQPEAGGPGDPAAEQPHEHHAGAPECAWCPLCRALQALRRTSPEVRAHLLSAASSLAQAAAAVLATTAPGDPDGRRQPDVERIDLDEDLEDWPEEDA